MGLDASTKEQKHEKILELKLSTSAEELCKGLPEEFRTYLNYARALRFNQRPDYQHLRQLFRDVLAREGLQYDYAYDWLLDPTTPW